MAEVEDEGDAEVREMCSCSDLRLEYVYTVVAGSLQTYSDSLNQTR
jgi:hypothetical protein